MDKKEDDTEIYEVYLEMVYRDKVLQEIERFLALLREPGPLYERI